MAILSSSSLGTVVGLALMLHHPSKVSGSDYHSTSPKSTLRVSYVLLCILRAKDSAVMEKETSTL